MPIVLSSNKVTRVKTSVSLPQDVQREAYRVARQHDISLSEYVTKLLRADLEERQKDGSS
jgi:hypothetical protein